MNQTYPILLTLIGISSAAWIYLLAFRGRFWRCDQRLQTVDGLADGLVDGLADGPLGQWPSVCAIIPARNEASVLPQSLRSLLEQPYPGDFQVMVVDDQSTDGTAAIARQTAAAASAAGRLQVTTTEPLPIGWSGKLWAVHQGIECVRQADRPLPDYFLLTDADIFHGAGTLLQLVTKAEQEQLDLVSLMVLLRCESFWEKLLIPAFVFFFQKLYPFPWVNQPQRSVAAAAGGCVLVRQEVLSAVGGIEVIRKALIDDCALGAAIKSYRKPGQGRIWLGLTTTTTSLRPYPSLKTIWDMVARTAFTQLAYSFGLLLISVLGMALLYLLPPCGLVLGLVSGFGGHWAIAWVAGLAWGLMTLAYWPTIRLYGLGLQWALTLPLVGFLYMLMTLDSALLHLQGRGGAWKGRVYSTAAVKQ